MRIGIVNDVSHSVDLLRRVIASAPRHAVAWTAADGAEAVRRCAEDRPDLVLMDLFMPHMDGVEATQKIMAATPCAVLIVTADSEHHCGKVFEAMGAGALDVADTPRPGGGTLPHGAEALLVKIDLISKLVGERPAPAPAEELDETVFLGGRGAALIAIGSSAGGPTALAKVLGKLPAGFPAAIVVIQHVDERFAPGLAGWLGSQTQLPVRLVPPGGARPEPGVVLLAGREDHLVLRGPGMLAYTPEPADYSYRPSVDLFFESVASHWAGVVVGVMLTGMGRDGARGLRQLRDKGHHTIAQNEATSAVYGMPKAAVALEAAVEVLPLEKIGARLKNMFVRKVEN